MSNVFFQRVKDQYLNVRIRLEGSIRRPLFLLFMDILLKLFKIDFYGHSGLAHLSHMITRLCDTACTKE